MSSKITNEARTDILQAIFNYFQRMAGWATHPARFCEYESKAVGLIEYLEVLDCGQNGGFDAQNPGPGLGKYVTNYAVFDRFLTLLRKESCVIQPECNFTVASLTRYFSLLADLRDIVQRESQRKPGGRFTYDSLVYEVAGMDRSTRNTEVHVRVAMGMSEGDEAARGRVLAVKAADDEDDSIGRDYAEEMPDDSGAVFLAATTSGT
jgi:hypothetical protein